MVTIVNAGPTSPRVEIDEEGAGLEVDGSEFSNLSWIVGSSGVGLINPIFSCTNVLN